MVFGMDCGSPDWSSRRSARLEPRPLSAWEQQDGRLAKRDDQGIAAAGRIFLRSGESELTVHRYPIVSGYGARFRWGSGEDGHE